MMHKHHIAKRVERANASQRRKAKNGADSALWRVSLPANDLTQALTHGNVDAIPEKLLPAVRWKNVWWCAQSGEDRSRR